MSSGVVFVIVIVVVVVVVVDSAVAFLSTLVLWRSTQSVLMTLKLMRLNVLAMTRSAYQQTSPTGHGQFQRAWAHLGRRQGVCR